MVKFHFLLCARWCRCSFRVKTRPLACPILSASPEPRLSRGANERKARQSAGRINPGRVRRRETGAALMPGLSRRAPPTGHGEYEEVPPNHLVSRLPSKYMEKVMMEEAST